MHGGPIPDQGRLSFKPRDEAWSREDLVEFLRKAGTEKTLPGVGVPDVLACAFAGTRLAATFAPQMAATGIVVSDFVARTVGALARDSFKLPSGIKPSSCDHDEHLDNQSMCRERQTAVTQGSSSSIESASL